MSPHAEDPITTVDLSAFGRDGSPEARRDAARALGAACSALGAARLTGLGLPEGRIDEALAWTKRLFDLPREDKIKAPHPPTAMPHRGYSGPGREKVYSKAERDRDEAQGGQGAELRKIEDYKVRHRPRPRARAGPACDFPLFGSDGPSVNPRNAKVDASRAGELRGRQRSQRLPAQRLAARGRVAGLPRLRPRAVR